ncbi:extracellular matrix-binding ebh [Babesia caballi]|uniref:Extracellular matrix-binding ebh n=1 Tax=Babesia caballi TaxID=5871 RepID=A0AAV4LRH2_BABCB|nr:extracellular matrix-binding ebh [Babesia caballi]
MFEKLKGIVKSASIENHVGDNVDPLNQFWGQAFNGQGNNETSGVFSTLCQNVASLFGDNNINTSSLSEQNHLTLQNNDLKSKVTNQANTLTPSSFTNSTAKALAAGVKSGAYAFLAEIQTKTYTSFYKGAQNKDVNNVQCAKIFLSCLPLFYQAFTYIYWRCDSSGNGEWETQTFDGSKGHHLKYFMFAMNYEASYLNNRRGSDVLSGAMKTFADFKDGMNQAQTGATKRASAVTAAIRKIYTGAPADSNHKPTYPEFLGELQKRFPETLRQHTNKGNSLAALYYCALCYFKCQQQKNVTKAVKTPTTIREMLYYLAALPFSPNYDAFNTHVTEHFKKLSGESTAEYDATLMIPVADSGMSTEATERYGGNTLSAADIKDYLTETCMYSMSALGWLQGPGASQKDDEPWLHSLFSNSQFNLSYSSGQAIFNVLANCAYAVQFQLSFLFSTCANNGMKCGWQECRYGRGVNASGTSSLKSHICPGFKCQNFNCQHNGSGGTQCTHNQGGIGASCGKNGSTLSPLQAFLTDNLKGFSRSHLGTSDHLASCSANSMCHVPMGLQATHLRQNAGTGNHIYSAFYSFCGTSSSPLRQLSEKLSCLTKRTPRTLGDLFGFVWHLNGQLFQNTRPTLGDLIGKFDRAFNLGSSLRQTFTTDPYSVITTIWNHIAKLKYSNQSGSSTPSVLSRSLESMAPAIPLLYQLFMAKDEDSLPVVLFDLKQQCHKVEVQSTGRSGSSTILITHSINTGHKCSSTPAVLFSLQTSRCTTGPNCGGYLSPLTRSYGSTFGKSAAFASTYLSWVSYLADDFKERLEGLLIDFTNITCTDCTTQKGKQCTCTRGNHGGSQCSCDSVVSCSGVLPLFYEHGFNFFNVKSLSGKVGGNGDTKRTCAQFHSQLQTVTNGDPLYKLLIAVDKFLYAIRWEFFSKLSGFWTIYIGLILYTFFFLLDTLHLRSHLKLTASHTVPPIAMLGTGKAPELTKFTKLTYFIP